MDGTNGIITEEKTESSKLATVKNASNVHVEGQGFEGNLEDGMEEGYRGTTGFEQAVRGFAGNAIHFTQAASTSAVNAIGDDTLATGIKAVIEDFRQPQKLVDEQTTAPVQAAHLRVGNTSGVTLQSAGILHSHAGVWKPIVPSTPSIDRTSSDPRLSVTGLDPRVLESWNMVTSRKSPTKQVDSQKQQKIDAGRNASSSVSKAMNADNAMLSSHRVEDAGDASAFKKPQANFPCDIPVSRALDTIYKAVGGKILAGLPKGSDFETEHTELPEATVVGGDLTDVSGQVEDGKKIEGVGVEKKKEAGDNNKLKDICTKLDVNNSTTFLSNATAPNATPSVAAVDHEQNLTPIAVQANATAGVGLDVTGFESEATPRTSHSKTLQSVKQKQKPEVSAALVSGSKDMVLVDDPKAVEVTGAFTTEEDVEINSTTLKDFHSTQQIVPVSSSSKGHKPSNNLMKNMSFRRNASTGNLDDVVKDVREPIFSPSK
ncbi:uncharacterized protein LOC107809895 [Nicotiana tabacum]|uniref:uncharacterized protein LOC107809895 n=1 Tax=Nicotiana tabacum TaxID=4097 RepID=UPI003F4F1362